LVSRAVAKDYEEWLAAPADRTDFLLKGNLRWLTARIGQIPPLDIAAYQSAGGFEGLRKALGMSPEAVRAMIGASGLVGRGGAAFPTGIKWDGAAQAPGEPKYVVLNADESEMGTFKDRVLLEYDPFASIEGMIIAAFAIGASYGYVYIRGEYRKAQSILAEALQLAEQYHFLGDNILESGFNFHLELRSGAGAYICGEETALFESIEGKRGFPRIKPPFPTTHGLFGQPTVINNVETICNVPFILREGVESYRSTGTEKSPGTKLFCLSGDVRQPCLVEAPFGITLRELIDEFGGGLPAGRTLQAVLLGGAAGTFIPPEQLDLRLTFEDTRQAKVSIGSGAVMVFDDRRDLRRVLVNLAGFFAHESCGKCYPCQLGTQRQLEVLERFARGVPVEGDAARLQDTGWTMTDASLCGLGQTAAMAVLSAMEHWPHLFGER
jgi:NADH-quinone oxidoreductase subunit F